MVSRHHKPIEEASEALMNADKMGCAYIKNVDGKTTIDTDSFFDI